MKTAKNNGQTLDFKGSGRILTKSQILGEMRLVTHAVVIGFPVDALGAIIAACRAEETTADSTQDEQTKRSYFLAKVEVDPTLLKRVAPQVNLSAGMPADVSIMTGTRTALQYAVDPLMNAFRRSFVED